MLTRVEEYLHDLALIPGLAGFEQKVAAYMQNAFEAIGLSTEIDTFGNCIARVQGSDPEAPVVMAFAHMDSLGFLVRKIEEDGFIRIERLGGIPEKALPSTQIQIQCLDGSMVDGVIGIKAHHVTPPEEKYVVDKYPTLFIDIGAASREDVMNLGIRVGCPIVYKPKFVHLQGTRVLMSASDNRSGCTVLLELAHHLKKNQPPCTTYIVGSVQEEYNLRGAMMAARTVKPDIAFCIDGGGSSDTPDLKDSGEVYVGRGPVMTLYNFHGRGTLNGTIAHPAMVRIVEAAARKAGLPLQYSAHIGGLTDLSYVQLEGKGVKCIDVGFPGRYAHSPCEVVDLKDIDACAQLVATAVGGIDRHTDFSR